MDLDYFITPTNKQQECFLPKERPKTLVAFDIVDKLKDLEAEFACEILEMLVTYYEEVQDYLVENHIDLLIEEEEDL